MLFMLAFPLFAMFAQTVRKFFCGFPAGKVSFLSRKGGARKFFWSFSFKKNMKNNTFPLFAVFAQTARKFFWFLFFQEKEHRR